MKKSYAGAASRDESARTYRLTIIENRSLVQRLTLEISFAAVQIRRSWPEVKRDPIGYGKRRAGQCTETAVRLVKDPNAVAGSFVAIVLVAFAVLLAAVLGQPVQLESVGQQDVKILTIAPLSAGTPQTASGIGVGSHGRIGFGAGKGEGSERQRQKARGGGGSGKHNILPTQQGHLFQPSAIAAANPNLPLPRNPSLPQAGIDIDPMLWKAQATIPYGNPRSNAMTPSNGPGDGGNFGSGRGLGIGEGDGPGFGPGTKGNMGGGEKSPGGGGIGGGLGENPDDPDRVFTLDHVTQRARVLLKPEPQYTEEARRNQITGTVMLRVVFSRTAQVTNIRVIQSLPFGLTEKAILAARQIKFSPALKDGRPVSVYMQLEYNFNLY
jgi:TonB family protein